MVRNINGGSKTKSRARKDITSTPSREIRLPEDELEFIAYVTKACGDGRFDVTLTNGEKISCIVRGKHKGKGKRNGLVVVGSLILVGLREWENPRKNSDLICIYSPYEMETIRRLPNVCLSHFPIDEHLDSDLFSFTNNEQPIINNSNAIEPVEVPSAVSDEDCLVDIDDI